MSSLANKNEKITFWLQTAAHHYAGERLELAIEACEQVLQLQRYQLDALFILGAIYLKKHDFKAAENWLTKTLQHCVHNKGRVLEALGKAKLGLGKGGEAKQCFARAISADRSLMESYLALAGLEVADRNYERAEVVYHKLLTLNATHLAGLTSLSTLLGGQGRIREAEELLQRAAEVEGDNVAILYCQGRLALLAADHVKAEAVFRKAAVLHPDSMETWQAIPYMQNYRNDLTPAQRLETAREIGGMISQYVRINSGPVYDRWIAEAKPERLRVGLVSGDFRTHPVGFFLANVLPYIDLESIELIAYVTMNSVHDEISARLQASCSRWVEVENRTYAELAKKIHDDGVHILIDLAGHTAFTRLPMFALKPAPVQVAWLGYWATTGLPEMDYILVDEHVALRDEENIFSEQRYWLPDTYRCFAPPQHQGIGVNELPALAGDQPFTFGCFNNLSKITPHVVAVWARILEAVPHARLLLKATQLNSPVQQDEFRAFLREHGMDGERVVLQASAGYEEYLRAYHQIDMALDPFPYTGGTVSVEGLWMGVPMLTRAGNDMLSRSGQNLLNNVGMQDWVALDDDDYVRKAVELASDLEGLAGIRRGLRAKLEASPICDGPKFARNLQQALWDIWEKYVESQAS